MMFRSHFCPRVYSSPSGGGDAIVGIPWESKQWMHHKKLVESIDLDAAHTL